MELIGKKSNLVTVGELRDALPVMGYDERIQFAHRVGVSASELRKFKHKPDYEMQPDALRALAKHLGMDVHIPEADQSVVWL